jgi:hypothetical protein
MGVVRARVIFPYKVGHFFNAAGPLRADLVKFTVASRDVPRGERPRGVPLRRGLARCGGGRSVGDIYRDAPGWAGDIYVGRGYIYM